MDVLRPHSLDEALRLRSEVPAARVIQGGTDVMVEVNAGHSRPEVFLDLSGVDELRGWSRDGGTLVLGAGLTYAELLRSEVASALPALAEAARTVGSPQIRSRGTIGGNLGTASPAGDALPPLRIEGAVVELASVRGERTLPLGEFATGPKRTALAPDELIVRVRVDAEGRPQTFLKVGRRNAMVISVCSLALVADREKGEVRAAYGSAGPVVGLVTSPLEDADAFPDAVAAAASPIDDIRGSAAYRRHALRVLTRRALARCLA